MVPKVTINGGSLSLVTNTPFRKPQASPVTIPAKVPITRAAPWGLVPPITIITQAPTIPLRAIIDPTDRSIPAEMIIAVIPTAIMPLTLERRNTFRKLPVDRNVSGLRAERVQIINIRLPKGSNCLTNLLIERPPLLPNA
ncbi:hypothetical protein ES703_35104 [subsurface metagenome]